jgi:hypothetical protein
VDGFLSGAAQSDPVERFRRWRGEAIAAAQVDVLGAIGKHKAVIEDAISESFAQTLSTAPDVDLSALGRLRGASVLDLSAEAMGDLHGARLLIEVIGAAEALVTALHGWARPKVDLELNRQVHGDDEPNLGRLSWFVTFDGASWDAFKAGLGTGARSGEVLSGDPRLVWAVKAGADPSLAWTTAERNRRSAAHHDLFVEAINRRAGISRAERNRWNAAQATARDIARITAG